MLYLYDIKINAYAKVPLSSVFTKSNDTFPICIRLKNFYGIALIHPLDIDQRGMHGFPGFLNWNSFVALFLVDD